jgi:acyl-activating enzyme 14
MTEACSSITFATLLRPRGGGGGGSDEPPSSSAAAAAGLGPAAACVGFPAPGVQVRIAPLDGAAADDGGPSTSGRGGGRGGGGGDSGGATAAAGAAVVGEVWTRGPHLMSGYWHDAAATSAALAPGGWLRTGDVGALGADGRLHLLGRVREMIKSGGENVYALEVEAALCAHPGVSAAAAAGLPDARLGERVGALVVLRPGYAWAGGGAGGGAGAGRGGGGASPPPAPAERTLDAAALVRFCRGAGLSGFKLPRSLAAVAALPANSAGKVLRADVRAALLQAEKAAAVSGGGRGGGASKL